MISIYLFSISVGHLHFYGTALFLRMLVSLITPWPALVSLRDTHYYTVPVYEYEGHNYIRIFDFRFYQTVLAGYYQQHTPSVENLLSLYMTIYHLVWYSYHHSRTTANFH